MLLTLLAASPSPLAAGEAIDRTESIPADGLVFVENMAGSIEFMTWDRDAVQLRGEAGDQVEEVAVRSTANGLQIRVVNRRDVSRVDGTDLYLKVPASASLEAESVSADITVRGNRGANVLLRTVSGDLNVESASQRVELKTVSGDIGFEGTTPRAALETVSGDIVVVGASGEVGAKTVSGEVSLDTGEIERGRFEAVSGDLTLSLSLAAGGRLGADSMSGDIKLSLPGSQQAEFSVQSYSGSIHSDFGESARVSRGPGVVLEHREGDGGAKIRLESFSGDISIRRH
jgi:DUF4097 and DUF4098 domain-containing protein YvlB